MPYSCFFRMSDDADTEPENRVDLGMFDVCYLKIFNSRY